MSTLRFASLLLAALAVGCGPTMRHETIGLHAFEATEPCGQGPYEVVVPASGSRWGESVRVYAYAPHPIEGTVEMTAGDEAPATGTVGSWQTGEHEATTRDGEQYRYVTPGTPLDRSRCLAVDAEAALQPGVVVPGGESEYGGPSVAVPEETGTPTVSAPSLELTAVRWNEPFDLSARALALRHLGRMQLIDHSWVPPDLEVEGGLAAGTPIRIRFWSSLPNPMDGVTFVVVHSRHQPSVTDEEWIAHVTQQRADDERRDAERAARERRRHVERQAHCAAHHEDEGCWGRGGYEGAVARMNAERDRPRVAAPTWVPPEASAPPTPSEPDGPPPAPRAESRPPTPSQHATWIPGYWRWHAARWVWLGGSWEVPEEDLRVEATVVAPSAPPPPQMEAQPPAPAPGMAWVPGYWQWDGARFVWVSGRHALPQPQARWQAPTWRARAGGVAFVPGRWTVHVR